MNPTRLVGAIMLLMSSISLSAQWGKVSPEMVKVASFSPFEKEDAVIMEKTAEYNIVTLPTGLEARIHHYVRIKIQTQAGIDFGDVELFYYPKERAKEITKFKGRIHYLENGEVKSQNVDKVFREQLNPKVGVLRCAFPNVSPGAIIEYQYDELRSSIFSYTFEFQQDLPVLRSEFEWIQKDDIGYAFAYQGVGIDQLQKIGPKDSYHYKMVNLPALKDVPFVPNMEDYRSKMNM